jgi:hypothetical protein
MIETKPPVSKKGKWIKTMRKFHKWPGIILAIFLLLFSLSGIILNHRNWFSSVEILRKLLPPDYRIKNWNLASIKGSVHVSEEDMVIYGNIGAWLTNHNMDRFIDLNHGFPKGIDSRKIEAMLLTSKGELLAGTLFGLYKYDGISWQNIPLPVSEKRITDLMEHDGVIHVLTRSYILTSANLDRFKIIELPASLTDDNKISLFKTLWTLHSGEMFGEVGKIAVDIMALGLVFLAISGILHWLFPLWIKRRKKKEKSITIVKDSMRTNLKWHNKIGYILAFFLVFTAITGIFLRPPLLITIASTRVEKIPLSKLDDPNPWHDKLRRIAWDINSNSYLVSTSDGFFRFDSMFTDPAVRIPVQPPVSVMGCTVFERHHSLPDTWLVGSFSGLFLWNLQSGAIHDAISLKAYLKPNRPVSPISGNLISGYILTPESEFIVEYMRGMESLAGKTQAPQMPSGIIDATPMSLWNFGLEVHTGRIFHHLIGSFYILYIPLAGLTLLAVLISGFVIWWLAYRKGRKKQSKNENC